MRLFILAGAAFALAIAGLPASAQQPAPDAAPAEALPEPPPFPPYPPEPSHRWVDMGEHHARSSHHRASTHHRKSTHHRATRVHHAAHKRHSTRAHHSNARFSTRTVRNCHRMTYKRIMRDNLCRAMMTQDLKKRRTRHHASKHRHAAHHRASAHHRRKPHHA